MAKKISGMHPDHDKHYSYTIAEPILGIPIDQRARTQSNLVIPHLTGFPADIQKFSEMILPMFWIEYVIMIFYLFSIIDSILIETDED